MEVYASRMQVVETALEVSPIGGFRFRIRQTKRLFELALEEVEKPCATRDKVKDNDITTTLYFLALSI